MRIADDAIKVDGFSRRILFARAQITVDGETQLMEITFHLRWYLQNRGTNYDEFIDIIADKFHCERDNVDWIEFISLDEEKIFEPITTRHESQPMFNTLILDL
jgi:hypothetical protein